MAFLILISTLEPHHLFDMSYDPFNPAMNTSLRELGPGAFPRTNSFTTVLWGAEFRSESLEVPPRRLDHVQVGRDRALK